MVGIKAANELSYVLIFRSTISVYFLCPDGADQECRDAKLDPYFTVKIWVTGGKPLDKLLNADGTKLMIETSLSDMGGYGIGPLTISAQSNK